MPHPKTQNTRTTKRKRASHFGLKGAQTTACPTCQAPIMPHHACQFCGKYKGRQVLDVEKRKQRRLRRVKSTQ